MVTCRRLLLFFNVKFRFALTHLLFSAEQFIPKLHINKIAFAAKINSNAKKLTFIYLNQIKT